MMDESRTTNDKAGRSFSEINELPPMKEIYVAPEPPPAPEAVPEPVDLVKATVFKGAAPEKPKVQPREVATEGSHGNQKTPPKLFFYSIAGAVGVILIIVVGIVFHIRSENSDDDAAPAQAAATAAQPSAVPAQSPVGYQSSIASPAPRKWLRSP